jgi:hypothetical protein
LKEHNLKCEDLVDFTDFLPTFAEAEQTREAYQKLLDRFAREAKGMRPEPRYTYE